MNKEKTKKLAFAVVAMVMAGSMAFSLAACGGGGGEEGEPNPGPGPNPGGDITEVKDKYGVLNEDGTINYAAYERETPVTLNIGIGHNSLATGTSFQNIGQEIVLPDGKTYSQGAMKPAWVQLGADLNITWHDVFQGKATNSNLDYILSNNDGATGETYYKNTDIFTSDLSIVVEKAAGGAASVLNLADYLDYMPNFKTFLLENPVVYLSLLQDGMDTTTGEDQVLYVAPYFDGNDDIERYCIVRQDWVEILLNGNTATEGSTAWGKATSVEGGHMGTTGSYSIESLNADGTDKITITKNYADALAAAKSASTPLGQAISAAGLSSYTGTSGNIVDIMNAVIAANQNVTGAQLVNIYRAYIDVCYQVNGEAYYTAATRANVFNGYDACWDVDDLVAILRCVTTNAQALGGNVGGIAPRSGQNDRTPDMVRLAAQLYGVRGADSRNENTYIDAHGNIQDARQDADIYNAMAKFNLLYQEGLIANYSSTSFKATAAANGGTDYFMMYDYVQTQTVNGFYAEDPTLTGVTVDDGYDLAPILTPVSYWDDDSDGTKDTAMRFTESWRSVKTSGIALNGSLASNPDKLKAALQFVDYLYSEDGQIVSTFGPMATNSDGNGGFWYNEEATSQQIAAGEYFTYKGVKYAGSYYKGDYTPTITDDLYSSFKGNEVNGWSVKENSVVSNSALNFTNYARQLIGSTLPVGVKSQSFEYQLTSECGRTGSDKVGQALAMGVIKGLSLQIDADNYWYTCVPTSLPVPQELQTGVLDSSAQQNFKYLTGTQKSDKNFYSIFNWIIMNGTSSTYNQQDVVVTYTSIDNLLNCTVGGTDSILKLATSRESTLNEGWRQAKEYWAYLSTVTAE